MNVGEEFLKVLWLNRLPSHIQVYLRGIESNIKLKDLAIMADKHFFMCELKKQNKELEEKVEVLKLELKARSKPTE